MTRTRRATAVVAVAAIVASACGSEAEGGGGGRIDVVATFHPLAEAATAVGGDEVRVTNITPPGVEPHDVELTSRQVDDLEDADLVVYLGGDFQPAVADVASRRDEGAIDVLESLDLDAGGDPHFWLDPTVFSRAVGAIERALVERAPEAAEVLRRNGARYRRQLAVLDGELRSGLAECERRTIVTGHEAFSFLARRYDLQEVAIAGLSPEVEPDPERLGEVADIVEQTRATTIFRDPLSPPAVARAVAREASVQVAVLDPLEGLTRMQIDRGDDYLTVMRRNLAALRAGLGCR